MASYSSNNKGQDSSHGLQGPLWSCPYLSLLLHIIPTLPSSWNPAFTSFFQFLTCSFPSQGQCTSWLLTSYSFFKSQLKHHSLSNTSYWLSKFIYLSLIAFNMLIILNYLCNYCIHIYLTHHTVDSMKIGSPFPPPLNTNTLAATMNRLQQCFVIMAIIPIQFTSNSKGIKPRHSKNSPYKENSH